MALVIVCCCSAEITCSSGTQSLLQQAQGDGGRSPLQIEPVSTVHDLLAASMTCFTPIFPTENYSSMGLFETRLLNSLRVLGNGPSLAEGMDDAP